MGNKRKSAIAAKSVAQVVSARSECADLIGILKGKLKIKGDIMSTGARWNAQSTPKAVWGRRGRGL